MADKLKRCPFCGGEAEYSTIDSSYVIPFGTIHHFVTCKNHCLEGLYSRGNTKEEAIEAWNNRPSPWHTGTPTEDGDYLVQYKNSGHDVLHFADLSWFAFNRGGVEWQKTPDSSVIAWQKIVPFKED